MIYCDIAVEIKNENGEKNILLRHDLYDYNNKLSSTLDPFIYSRSVKWFSIANKLLSAYHGSVQFGCLNFHPQQSSQLFTHQFSLVRVITIDLS